MKPRAKLRAIWQCQRDFLDSLSMKTLLLLAIVALIAFVVFTNVGPISQRVQDAKTCERLETLCSRGGESQEPSEDDCEDELTQLRVNVGNEPVERAGVCIASAQSCIEATGCIAGASVGVLKGFFSGFERALGNGGAAAGSR